MLRPSVIENRNMHFNDDFREVVVVYDWLMITTTQMVDGLRQS